MTTKRGFVHTGTLGHRFKDITGQQFGQWTVIRFVGILKRRAAWECRCSCGNLGRILGCVLRSGGSTRCPECPKVLKLPFGEAAFNSTLHYYRANANRVGRCWELTREQARELMSQPCVYCGKLPNEPPITCTTGRPRRSGAFIYNGIDRQDNSKGYTLANCVTCCAQCNHAKYDMSLADFLSWIDRIKKHNWSGAIKPAEESSEVYLN